jgi:hypothetical protein
MSAECRGGLSTKTPSEENDNNIRNDMTMEETSSHRVLTFPSGGFQHRGKIQQFGTRGKTLSSFVLLVQLKLVDFVSTSSGQLAQLNLLHNAQPQLKQSYQMKRDPLQCNQRKSLHEILHSTPGWYVVFG